MNRIVDCSCRLPQGSLERAVGFFAFWVVLSGFKLTDLPVGVATAVGATWSSLQLSPPGQWSFRPTALARLVLSFLRQSIGAGIEVAGQALDPRLPLRPGSIVYRTQLPQGAKRNAFCTLTSMLPGTLPFGTDETGAVVFHCLDTTKPVTDQLSAEEHLFVQCFAGELPNG
jgi:multicomponent Na+:H+ antiporter subunit E